jgi:hypothetical protein
LLEPNDAGKNKKNASWITDQLSGRREQETGQGTDLAPDPSPNAIKLFTFLI